MSIYNPKSMKAEEFINDAEIRETIAYAQANKNNVELIDSLLEKARPVKNGSGVTWRRPKPPRGGRAARLRDTREGRGDV